MTSRSELERHLYEEHGGSFRGGEIYDLLAEHRHRHEFEVRAMVFGAYHTHEASDWQNEDDVRWNPMQSRDDHGRWDASSSGDMHVMQAPALGAGHGYSVERVGGPKKAPSDRWRADYRKPGSISPIGVYSSLAQAKEAALAHHATAKLVAGTSALLGH